METEERFDAVVIGAGFGGLGAALTLAEQGARVALCEALRYPGGCASTFGRAGYRFDAGATLLSGFAPGQLFATWRERHRLAVRATPLDPAVELRAPGLELAVPASREALVASLCALDGAPGEGLRGFFALQARVAEALWALLDDPALLPPLDLRALLRHAARAPSYAPLLALVGRPLEAVLARFGLARFAPLRVYLDAVCQITVQASAREAEAPFALGAMDYYARGARHVHGGVGAFAEALVDALRGLDARVHLSDRVRRVEREPGGGFVVHTRKRVLRAARVFANVVPAAARALFDEGGPGASAALARLDARVREGWGAAMLYLGLDAAALREGGVAEAARHLELIDDDGAPFVEGNHVFCSLSAADEEARAPAGQRVATVSTHVPLAALRALEPAARGAYIAAVQERMRRTLARRAPAVAAAVRFALTASPRTFERFTLRPEGAVGGVPRRAGLGHYRALWPTQPWPRAYLVGDSVFPGQSALAAALGGHRAATDALRDRSFAPGRRGGEARGLLVAKG